MTKTGNIESLIELASSQWGLFTSAQALSAGVSRTQLSRMVSDGRVEQTSYATYRLAAGEETAHCGVKSAWLSIFPKATARDRLRARPRDAIVACRTAAYMHGDTDLHEDPYAFAVASGKRTTRDDVVLRKWAVEESDVVIVDGLPVTTIERTVADLVRADEDPSLVGNFLAGTCARGHVVNEGRLAELLSPLAARNGYDKGDGASFARRLVSNYADPGQMRLAADSFIRALEASPSYREIVERMAETLRASSAIMSKVSLPDFSQLPAMKAISQLQAVIGPYWQLSEGITQASLTAQNALEAMQRIIDPETEAMFARMAALFEAHAPEHLRDGGKDDEVQDA